MCGYMGMDGAGRERIVRSVGRYGCGAGGCAEVTGGRAVECNVIRAGEGGFRSRWY